MAFFYWMNAKLKALKTRSELDRLSKHYKCEPSPTDDEVFDQVKIDLAERLGTPLQKLSILWIGASYAQDHSGFVQSLTKFGELHLFYREGGEYGLELKAEGDNRLYDPEVRHRNSDAIWRNFSELSKGGGLNVVIGQMWANLVDPEVLQRIRNCGVVVINIAMDDKLPVHWRRSVSGELMGAVGLSGSVDITLTTSPSVRSWYAFEGGKAVYWPLACDPAFFYPRAKKVYDVVFIGGKYGLRKKLISDLMNLGVSVSVFGPGWQAGFKTAEESSEIFGSSKIVLGMGFVAYNDDVLTIKQRDFDAMASGALYITNRNPDLEMLFEEGEEIEYFSDASECADKIKFYLNNEAERAKIAHAGLTKIMKLHTWDTRLEDTFQRLAII